MSSRFRTLERLTAACDAVHVETDEGWSELLRCGDDRWTGRGVEIVLDRTGGHVALRLESAELPLRRVRCRWSVRWPAGVRMLGDHWERGYGDLEWRGLCPERVMPWFVVACCEDAAGQPGVEAVAFGVKTNPAAMCWWRTDHEAVELVLDVRCGGSATNLKGRRLRLADVVVLPGEAGESPFALARRFCQRLHDRPRLPTVPIYGGNDWYYSYGNSSQESILSDSARISDWAADAATRPFMVIDDGWQLCRPWIYNGGPWHVGNRQFPDMPGLAERMRRLGVRPGIWFRPLLTVEKLPWSWTLPGTRVDESSGQRLLDPSVPGVLEHVAEDVRRFVAWGFELIKFDFPTYDLLGRWGMQMGSELTDPGWSFADRTRTTAEIARRLYEVIREAAGPAILLGCNVIGHLAAGLVELNRTGDDTSGREWERTRKMGINTLAFRMPHHEAFYLADADCVGLTPQVPWRLNRQWLDVLARSGTPLFISADPAAVGAEQERTIREAFRIASRTRPAAEPLDWMETTCPRRWRTADGVIEYEWS